MATQQPVRSEPLVNGQPVVTRRGKDSAIVRRATLRRQRGAVERATAWIVLVLSGLGTIAALAGGWKPLIDSITARTPMYSAIIGGLAIQGVLTFLEWYYFDTRAVSWPARLIDTVATAIGYGPLFLAPLVAALLARGVTQANSLAWLIIGLASFAIAWYPESRLVD